MVSILFARTDSNYKNLPGTDVWDADRDATKWPGGTPVVAHPPCRAWGAFRHRAKPRKGERALAIFAVRKIREWGGVLEHPAGSKLWSRAKLPAPGQRDRFGGWTLGVNQCWWGHRAEKRTLLYICGCDPNNVPPIPFRLDYPTHVIGDVGRAGKNKRPEISKKEREHTPPEFANWLIELANRCARVGYNENEITCWLASDGVSNYYTTHG